MSAHVTTVNRPVSAANQAIFDVVIFDEASQITTWDAIGAIARGRQTIIVGDPKQLPPTNFFGPADEDAENDELEEYQKDLESILDEAQASASPPCSSIGIIAAVMNH